MHFGFALRGRGPLATPDALLTLARKAETLRYHSVFVTDHVVIPLQTRSAYPYAATGRIGSDWLEGYLEPLALMGCLVSATSRIRLGTSVLVIPYRNPVVTAKMLATLDVMSGGRVILGAGVGWMREEFEALQAPPWPARGRVTDEYLRLMREIWSREPVDFQGEHYRLQAVSALPKPRQKGGIPIWIGGHSDGALRRAGELGDAWHPIALRPPAMLLPEEYRQHAETVRRWAAKAGRDPEAVALTLRVPLDLRSPRVRPPAGERLPLSGTAAEVLRDLRAYRAAGATHVVFDPVAQDLRGWIAMMERFAEEVRPKLGRGRP